MSVPPDRMAARTPGTIKDPNKIMGLPKWAFFVVIALGVVVAWYIYKRSQSANAASLQTANAGTEPDTTNGVTAADIGGTPADNSFATQTDEMAIEEQIQALQNSLFQLQQSNGGNGAGLPNGSSSTAGGGTVTTPGSSTSTDTGGFNPNPSVTFIPNAFNPNPGGWSPNPEVTTIIPQSNAPGDLNLVAQGLTPGTVGAHLNPY